MLTCIQFSLSRQSSTITLGQDYGMSWSYDGLGRPATTTYDANGNLTSGANRSITWTSFDRPASITRNLAASSGPAINVALASNGGIATASSELGTGQFPIASIIDGVRTSPNWTLGGVGSGWNDGTYNAYPDWVEVDFAGSKTIGEIDVFTYDQNFNASVTLSTPATNYQILDFVVQYWSDASAAWVTVPGGSVTGNHNVWRQFTFSPITTTRIRVTVNNAENDNTPYLFSRIVELEAWTAPAATSNTATFVYGPEHQRIRQTVTGSNPITIYYAGAIEKEVTGSGTTVKTYMPRGIGYLSDTAGDTAVRYRYARGDHLGSSVMLTDDIGAVLNRNSYDAWGQRRNPDGSDDTTYSLQGYDRTGYTGQEMLDPIGLVHLNGRVYDPLVGRFVSADPLVRGDASGQFANRYSYVRNNPLNFTDPSRYEEEPDPPKDSCNSWCHITSGEGFQTIYDYHWFIGGYHALRAVVDQHAPLILTAQAAFGTISDIDPPSGYSGNCNNHECPTTLEDELRWASTHDFSVLDVPAFIPYVGGPYTIARGFIRGSKSDIGSALPRPL